MFLRILGSLAIVAFLALPHLGCESCDCNGGGGDTDGGLDGDLDGAVDGDALPPDGGDADPGDADGDGAAEPYAFDLHVYEMTEDGAQGEALEGVHVAVDTESGRTEISTDAEGVAAIEVEGDLEWMTLTMALEGYRVVTLYEATIEDVEYWLEMDGEIKADLLPLEGAAGGDLVDINITATGIAAGSSFCASATPFWFACVAADEIATFEAETTTEEVRIVGWVVDGEGNLTDFVEEVLASLESETDVELVFEGTADAPVVVSGVNLTMPALENRARSTIPASGCSDPCPSW